MERAYQTEPVWSARPFKCMSGDESLTTEDKYSSSNSTNQDELRIQKNVVPYSTHLMYMCFNRCEE